MNKTKKLTTGAMMLAIIGALMLLDRQLSYLFTELILLMVPVIISMYVAMYSFKDGLVLSVCLFILGILLGSVYSYFYVPLTVLVGLCYSWGVSKDFNTKKLLVIAIGSYVLGELLIMLVIQPLFGVNLAETIGEMEALYDQYMSMAGVSISSLESTGMNITTLLAVIYAISIALTGIMEGFLTHLATIILMRRFKIKDFTKGGIITFELNPVVAYICFLSIFSFYFIQRINNETIKYILISLGIFGSFILMYYGYVFVVTYIKRRMPNNRRAAFLPMLLIFLLFPYSILILIICGFLLGAGPLKNVLDKYDLKIK